MAKFLKLKIRGIRSIRDDDCHTHNITFLSPCTLINGPNGTGKTTTIEALNYITTGALPPGGMGSFIHSNSMAKKNRVDASVTLEFEDVKKRICTIVRRMYSIESTKTGKAQARSDEFTMNIKYPDGTTNSLSSKVCDFERAVLHHLGVPKAVLNHVVFCHQEDSTWPLSGPKELKEKFDEIFQLTKFVKAQNQIGVLKKKYKSEIQVQVEKKRRCEDLVMAYFEATKIRDKCTEQQKKGEVELERMKELRKEKLEKKSYLEKKIVSAEKTLRDLEKQSYDIENVQKQINLLRVEPYAGTLQQLTDEINEIKQETGFRNFENEKQSIARKMAEVSNEVQRLTRDKKSIENQIVELRAFSKHRDAICAQIQELEENLKQELKIEMTESDNFELVLRAAIERRREEMQRNFDETMGEADDFQVTVDGAQKKVTKLELEIGTCEKDGGKLEQEVQILEKRIGGIAKSSSRLDQLSKLKNQTEKELESLPEFDENTMTRTIQKREKLQKQLDELGKKCGDAEKFAENERELQKSGEEMENVKKQLAEFEKKHEKNWDALYGEAERPEAPWTAEVNEVVNGIRSGLKTVERQLKDAQLGLQHKKTTLEQLRNEEDKLTVEMNVLNETIVEECECEPNEVENRLKDVKKRVKMLRKELAPIDAKVVLYESWIEESNEKSCCPLCERKFASKSASSSFSQKLHDISVNFPSDREKLEKDVIRAEEEEGKLTKAQYHAQRLIKMKVDVKELAEKRSSCLKELKMFEKNVEEKTVGQEECLRNLKLATSLQTDVGMMDSLAEKSVKLETNLKALKKMLKSRVGMESYAELKEMSKEVEEKFRSCVREVDSLQDGANQRNALQSQLNKIREEMVTLGEDANQVNNLREQLKKKETELEQCQRNYQKLRMELPAARNKLEEAMMERTQRNDERRTLEVEMGAKLEGYKQKQKQLLNLAQKLDENSQCMNRMVKIEKDLKNVDEELENQMKRRMGLEMEGNNIQGSYNKLRILEDQYSKMGLEAKMKSLMEDMETLKKLGANRMVIKSMKEEYECLQREIGKVNEDEIRLRAVLEESEKRLNEAVRKLANRDVMHSKENYRKVILEITLLKEAVEDLEKYLKCLDSSLIKFHTEKMGAVNEIVDELWRKVYDSTDISTIRIQSKTNETGARNRAYDYNVMMVQEGGVEVEMRGRCSAGQKMLASLLIRIALAEVFGGLCSMIALDEPTTNLDDNKVEGMADILGELIEARQSVDGRGMQMVVITHDMRLTNRLTRGCRPDWIYILAKDENGMSYLKKRLPDGTELPLNRKY